MSLPHQMHSSSAKFQNKNPYATVFVALFILISIISLGVLSINETVITASIFTASQIAVAAGLIWQQDDSLDLSDIRLVFVLAYGLYGLSLPLSTLYNGTSIAGLAHATFLYGIGALGYCLSLFIFPSTWIPDKFNNRTLIVPSISSVIIFILLNLFYIWYIYYLGASISFSSIDRSQFSLLSTQLKVVTIFVIVGVGLFIIFNFRKTQFILKFAFLISLLGYIAVCFSLGNRRDCFPLIFCFFLIYICASKTKRIFSYLLLAITLPALLVFGTIRSSNIESREEMLQETIANNEFTSPIYTLLFAVNHPSSPLLGQSYLEAPLFFIPRYFWPQKPDSLAISFLKDAFGTTNYQAYAYTPVTEAYLNFWEFGPFIIIFLNGMFLSFLVKNVHKFPMLYVVAYTTSIDYNRGEFSGMVYEFIIIYTVMMICYKISLPWSLGKNDA